MRKLYLYRLGGKNNDGSLFYVFLISVNWKSIRRVKGRKERYKMSAECIDRRNHFAARKIVLPDCGLAITVLPFSVLIREPLLAATKEHQSVCSTWQTCYSSFNCCRLKPNEAGTQCCISSVSQIACILLSWYFQTLNLELCGSWRWESKMKWKR
jgi:hypothetical protein